MGGGSSGTCPPSAENTRVRRMRSGLALRLQFTWPTTYAHASFGFPMNSLRLVQSAILLVRQQRATIVESDREDALRQYWAHSQCRLQRWQESMHHFEVEARKMADLSIVRAVVHLPMIEEVVFADVLTTVFTGLVDSSEQPEPDENPVAHNVLTAARKTRLRTIARLDAVAKRNAQLRKPEHGIQQICRGRVRAELWAHILLGYRSRRNQVGNVVGV